MQRADPAPGAAPAVESFAPAKINLGLHVLGRRADGLHDLDMLVAFADVGDRVSWVRGGDSCRLRVEPGPFTAGSVPERTDNLAWRALALAGRLSAIPLAGELLVEKRLPAGAGLGGGSSDAAATLRALGLDALEVVSGATTPPVQLGTVLALGADVPVCLLARTCRVRGIGDRLEPLTLGEPMPVVLVWPGSGLSTAEVFRRRAGPFGRPIPETAITALAGDPLAAIAGLRNDLETTARRLFPDVGVALDRLIAAPGCRLARMSGSGSCVVGYFESAGRAGDAARAIRGDHTSWWVRAATLRDRTQFSNR